MTSRRPIRLRALALALVTGLALAAAGAGCGLFDTAQPEPPTSIGGLPPDFSTPDSLLATLRRSLVSKNAGNYIQCFADTLIDSKGFHAAFDPADLLDYQTSTGQPPPSDWLRPQENSFIQQFIGSLSGTPDVVLGPDPHPEIPTGATLVFLNRKFRVYVGPSTAAASSIGLQIERINPNGDWKITYWEDRRDSTGNVQTYGTRRLRGR